MQSHDTAAIIFNARIKSSERGGMYWLWLRSAYSILKNRVPDIFAHESDLERSYSAAKQIVMELWTIRALLIKLQINTVRFDTIAPNLKAFRNAIAHIDERAKEKILARGRKRESIVRSRTSLAGGQLGTDDGVHWAGFDYCYGLVGSSIGLYTPFGLVRDWIITNTDQGAVELQLTSRLFEKLDELIRDAAVGKISSGDGLSL
jgi:hypothetical protein